MNTKKELREDLNNAQYLIACLTAKVAAYENELVETHSKIATYEETVKEQAEKINTLYVEKRDVERERDIYKKSYDEIYEEDKILRKQNRELKGEKKVEKENVFAQTCREYAHREEPKTTTTKKCNTRDDLRKNIINLISDIYGDDVLIGFGII